MVCFGSFQLSLRRPSSQGLFVKGALIQVHVGCACWRCTQCPPAAAPSSSLLSFCLPLTPCLHPSPAPVLKDVAGPTAAFFAGNRVALNCMGMQITSALGLEQCALSEVYTLCKQQGRGSNAEWRGCPALFGLFPEGLEWGGGHSGQRDPAFPLPAQPWHREQPLQAPRGRKSFLYSPVKHHAEQWCFIDV